MEATRAANPPGNTRTPAPACTPPAATCPMATTLSALPPPPPASRSTHKRSGLSTARSGTVKACSASTKLAPFHHVMLPDFSCTLSPVSPDAGMICSFSGLKYFFSSTEISFLASVNFSSLHDTWGWSILLTTTTSWRMPNAYSRPICSRSATLSGVVLSFSSAGTADTTRAAPSAEPTPAMAGLPRLQCVGRSSRVYSRVFVASLCACVSSVVPRSRSTLVVSERRRHLLSSQPNSKAACSLSTNAALPTAPHL
mmetsp:Transcript_29664/g.74591  ORF Transcript_29664/g.74591 Transcript_29664/m.74591 type:complete len:255 (-) Transcript_29664:236-1000(-)